MTMNMEGDDQIKNGEEGNGGPKPIDQNEKRVEQHQNPTEKQGMIKYCKLY